MPLVGGGGSPNVAGAGNPAGTGTSLNYIGNHAYAFSGSIPIGSTPVTMLSFNTSNEYIVGQVQFSKNNNDGDDMQFQISFDGQVVMGLVDMVAPGGANYREQYVQLLIPPHTKVEITGDDLDGDNDRACLASFVGRVYA
jgi:hypothetical protein